MWSGYDLLTLANAFFAKAPGIVFNGNKWRTASCSGVFICERVKVELMGQIQT